MITGVLTTVACGGPSPAPWSDVPLPIGAGVDEAARKACRSAFEDAGEPLVLAVADRRTANYAGLYYRGVSYDLLAVVQLDAGNPALCDATLGGTAEYSGEPDLAASSLLRWRNGRALAGTVDAKTDRVVVDMGRRRMEASVADGAFMVFWPYDEDPLSIEGWQGGVLVQDVPMVINE